MTQLLHPIFQQKEPTWPPAAFRMDKAALERLMAHCERASLGARETLFLPGDPADRLYYVLKGSVALVVMEDDQTQEGPRRSTDDRLTDDDCSGLKHDASKHNASKHNASKHNASKHNASKHNASKHNASRNSPKSTLMSDDQIPRELVVGHANAGEFIGDLGLFHPTPERHIGAQARTACEIAWIRHGNLMALMEGELKDDAGRLLFAIGTHLSRRLLRTARKAGGLALVNVRERIMRAVIDLAHHPDAMTHPDGMQIKASRQDLARMSGCSREMAGRSLKELQAAGRLTAKGKTIVVFGIR